MILDGKQQAAIVELLRSLKAINPSAYEQSEIAKRASDQQIKVLESTISYLKKGRTPVADPKWKNVLHALESAVAENPGRDLEKFLHVLQSEQEQEAPSLAAEREFDRAKKAREFSVKLNPDVWLNLDPKLTKADPTGSESNTGSKNGEDERNQPHLYMARGKYSDIAGGLLPLQTTLGGEVIERLETDELKLKPELRDFNYASINWETAQMAKVLCLFPFYLTAARRFSWGVLRYGKLTHIGMVIPTSMIDKKRTNSEMKPADDEFIQVFRSPSLKLYHTSGYAMYSIFCQMVLNLQNGIDIIENIMQRSEKPTCELGHAVRETVINGGVMLFDLAERRNIKSRVLRAARDFGMSEDHFRFLTLDHGEDVPVGIGFSLPTLEWLENSGAKRTLIELAGNYLSSYKKELAEIGIKLDSHFSKES